MAFVGFNDKQDMQDDTFKIIAWNISEGVQYAKEKDVKGLHSVCEALTDVFSTRLKSIDAIDNALTKLKKVLYRIPPPSKQQLTTSMDETRTVWRVICKELDEAGILLRAKQNVNELYKRGGRG